MVTHKYCKLVLYGREELAQRIIKNREFKTKQVPRNKHLRVVISKHYLHYAHCISASLRLFETPSAVVRVAHVVADPVTGGRVEVASVCVDATVGLTRPIAPAVSGPIEFSCSV